MTKSLLTLLAISTIIFADPDTSSTRIDDGEKGSAPHGNLIDKVETAEKVFDIVNNAAGVIDGAKKLKGFDPKKIDFSGMSKSAIAKAKEWATVYTHSKGSFNEMTKAFLGKVDHILRQASKRVELWRTTLPTIKRYANSVKFLADDTKNLVQSFKMSDLLDIDRKWDRHLEGNLAEFRNTYYHIGSWLKTFQPEDEKKYMHSSIVPVMAASEFQFDAVASDAFSRMPPLNEYRTVSRTTLEFCASSMYTLTDLESQSKAPDTSDNTITIEMASFNKIDFELSNASQGYEDSRELATFIERERAKVRLQALQATQIQSAAELRYANLLKRDEEAKSASKDSYTNSLRVLCSGAGNYQMLQNH